jgi:hypothetical protein
MSRGDAAAAHVPGGRLNTLKYDGRQMICKMMNQAVHSGLTVVRAMVEGWSCAGPSGMTPGRYDACMCMTYDACRYDVRICLATVRVSMGAAMVSVGVVEGDEKISAGRTQLDTSHGWLCVRCMQMRMWGHTVTPGHALQPSEGVYDESIFQALDFVLDEARIRGLKLIIIFADNWCAQCFHVLRFLCAHLSKSAAAG